MFAIRVLKFNAITVVVVVVVVVDVDDDLLSNHF